MKRPRYVVAQSIYPARPWRIYDTEQGEDVRGTNGRVLTFATLPKALSRIKRMKP